jgi:deleted in liver cancer protein
MMFFLLIRTYRTDLPRDSCVAIEVSIEHPEARSISGVRGVVLASRYLIEPIGTYKSKIIHLARVDTK